MRKVNWRFIVAGVLLAVLGAGFFLYMMTIARNSTDPAGMMRIVSQVSGFGGVMGLFLVVLGLIGKKFPS